MSLIYLACLHFFLSTGPATDLGIRASLIEQHSPPEILIHGLVKPEDVEKLFEMYVPFNSDVSLKFYLTSIYSFYERINVGS